ncbi:MAG TPA: hypothetical protein VNV60_10480, partial [Holophagaceae bacterium]|nr:hypothetical protein [Holophagaceae bacterium]
MGTTKNQHGLSRDIPEDVAKSVRRDCGFGCVICGASIVTYEHIGPEFKDAKEHDPACIALLCGGCHDKVTRKFWSKEKVRQARNAPKCKGTGFSRGELDFGSHHPYIHFAGVLLRNCPIPVEVSGVPVFSITPPEEDGAPFRLSATFTDPHGHPSFEILNNVWELHSGSWDAECVGGRIEIRSHEGPYTLIVKMEPPNGIRIERLHMRLKHLVFEGNEHTLLVHTPSGTKQLTGGVYDNCH